MPGVSFEGAIGTGHGCFPPRPSTGGSPDVFVNGIPVLRETDPWATHCCGTSCHDSTQAAGSATVFANGLQLARIGDPVACGSAVAEGSDNVFAGG